MKLKKDKVLIDLNGYDYTVMGSNVGSTANYKYSAEIGINNAEVAELTITNSGVTANRIDLLHKLQLGWYTGSGIGKMVVSGSNTSLRVHTIANSARRLAVDARGTLEIREGLNLILPETRRTSMRVGRSSWTERAQSGQSAPVQWGGRWSFPMGLCKHGPVREISFSRSTRVVFI